MLNAVDTHRNVPNKLTLIYHQLAEQTWWVTKALYLHIQKNYPLSIELEQIRTVECTKGRVCT